MYNKKLFNRISSLIISIEYNNITTHEKIKNIALEPNF